MLKICVILNKEKGVGFIQILSDDQDDKDDEYDSKFFTDLNAQNMSRIKMFLTSRNNYEQLIFPVVNLLCKVSTA